MFDDAYASNLPSKPAEAAEAAEAARTLCDDFRNFHTHLPHGAETENLSEYLTAHAILQALAEVIGHQINLPSLGNSPEKSIGNICDSFNSHGRKFDAHFASFSVDKFRSLFAQKFNATFLYQFTDGDIDRIQQLISELRENIGSAEGLDEDHRLRLLRRLEKLQSELHKKVSDLDRFWGLVGEAGVVMGKIGEDAKPIVDRIRELAEIVWRTQARTEELPSGAPLPSIESNDED